MLLALATSTCPSVEEFGIFRTLLQHSISLSSSLEFLSFWILSFDLSSNHCVLLGTFSLYRFILLASLFDRSLSFSIYYCMTSTQVQNLFDRIFNIHVLFYPLNDNAKSSLMRGESRSIRDARESPSMPLRCPWANASSCSFVLLSGFCSLLSFHFYF